MRFSILVVGYYNKNNLGDDMLRDSIKLYFPSHDLTFVNSDLVDLQSLNKYDIIILGAGDLVNSYFLKEFRLIRSNFQKPILGFGLGVPYPSMIQSHGVLDIFDGIYVRNMEYLKDIQKVMGNANTHYLPDLTFRLFTPRRRKSDSNWIGVCLVPPFIKNSFFSILVETFLELIKTSNLNFHFLAFDTCPDGDNDYPLLERIGKSLPSDRIIVDRKRYTSEEMLDKLGSFHFNITSRFHGHILSILAGVPFLSFHYANKVSLLIKENSYPHFCPIETDSEVRPVSFSKEKFLGAFWRLEKELVQTEELLVSIAKKNSFLLENSSLDSIVRNQKRRPNTNSIHLDRVNLIFNIYQQEISSFGIDWRTPLSDEQASIISKDICYEITGDISSSYVYGTTENLKEKPHQLREMIDWIWKDKMSKSQSGFDFRGPNLKGQHRSGWPFAIGGILGLQDPYGILMDTYCDASFGWARESPLAKRGLVPYTQLWVGWFHHPPYLEFSDNHLTNAINSVEFRQSLPTCRGLFTLSEYLADWLRKHLDIPIFSLLHPTNLQVKMFNLECLEKEIKLVNIGSWLRNCYSIYEIEVGAKKYRLKGKDMDGYFPPKDFSLDKVKTERNNNVFYYSVSLYLERGGSPDLISEHLKSVEVIEHLSDSSYDDLLSESVVFLDMLEASAINTVIECMARGTPLIVNRLPAIEEYLGKDYPLFFEDLKDVKCLLNKSVLKRAYFHMLTIRDKLSIEFFHEGMLKVSKEL